MTEPSGNAPKRGWRALRADQLSGLILIAFALFLGWENRVFPIGTLESPGPGFLPLGLAIFLGFIGLVVVLLGGHSQRLRDMKWREIPRGVLILALCAVGAFALERLGYRLTVMILLIILLGVVERRRPLPVALVSIGFAFISYYIVGNLLLVPLPRGPWGF